MDFGKASASCGQDEQDVEDVTQVPAGPGQDKRVLNMSDKFQQVIDKINRVQKMLVEIEVQQSKCY